MAQPQNLSAEHLFNNPLFSDVKIRQTCNGVTKEYFAHKNILYINSKWFQAALTGEYKEATDDVIELHDDDPAHFKVMLKYFYTQDWHYGPEKIGEGFSDPLDGHFDDIKLFLDVFSVAKKYACDALAQLAVANFEIAMKLESEWEGFTDDELHEIPRMHYDRCANGIECEMGRVLAEKFVTYLTDYDDQNLDIECVQKHPEFGRDLLLACIKLKVNFDKLHARSPPRV